MSKNLSAEYYQEIKKDCKKKLVKDINIFLKKKKKKSNNMVMKIWLHNMVTKISQKMKNKSLWSTEKIL